MSNMSAAVITSPDTEHEAQDKAADEAREASNGSSDNDSSPSETRQHKTMMMTGDKDDDDKSIASVSPSTSGRVTHVRQLFVGNLPFRVRWQDVKDLFRKAGNVTRADVALTVDNRSKGHGTVLFATVEDAQKAIDMLHNYKWQGRVLEVREDRGFIEPAQRHHHHHHHHHLPFHPPPPSAFPTNGHHHHHPNTALLMNGSGPMGGPPEVIGGRQLFVGNLPFQCQWQDVKDLFRNAGNILRADVVQDQDGRSRGFGTVLYATHEDAKKAIAMYNGFEFRGRQLRVHFDKFAPGPALIHHHRPPPPPHISSAYGLPMHPPHPSMFDDFSQPPPYLPHLPLAQYPIPFGSMDFSQAGLPLQPPPASLHMPPPPPLPQQQQQPHPMPPFPNTMMDPTDQPFTAFPCDDPALLLRQFTGSPRTLASQQQQHNHVNDLDTFYHHHHHPPPSSHHDYLVQDPFLHQGAFHDESSSFVDDTQMAMLASSTLGPIGISFADAPVITGVATTTSDPGFIVPSTDRETSSLFGMTPTYSPWSGSTGGGPMHQHQFVPDYRSGPEPTTDEMSGSMLSSSASPQPSKSPDDQLVDAVNAMSLTDGSAGLTSTKNNNKNGNHVGLTPPPPPTTTSTAPPHPPPPPPSNHLLSSSSVWEPLGGFKY